MEGRVAGIDANIVARSSSSLGDLRDDSLHTEVEASDTNWLFSLGPGSAIPNTFCVRVAARVYILFLFPYSPNILNLFSVRKLVVTNKEFCLVRIVPYLCKVLCHLFARLLIEKKKTFFPRDWILL